MTAIIDTSAAEPYQDRAYCPLCEMMRDVTVHEMGGYRQYHCGFGHVWKVSDDTNRPKSEWARALRTAE